MTNATPEEPVRVAVVGGGISGLAYAYYLQRTAAEHRLPVQLTVLEEAAHVGGRVRTIRDQGYLVECGANGVLGSKPAAVSLAYELGLGDELVRASRVARWRYIFHRGQLHSLPLGLMHFCRSPLLSPSAKLRLLCEPFVPRWRDRDDPALKDWAVHRFGAETTEVLIDAMCAGVYGVGPQHLSARSAFPQLWEWEQRYGSVLWGGIRGAFRRRQHEPYERALPEDFPRRGLWSFRNGMGTLPDALAAALGPAVRAGVRVVQLGSWEGQWVCVLHNHETVAADQVVLALDAHGQAQVLESIDQDAARILSSIRFVPLAVVALGFPRDRLAHPLNGFGFLIPSRYRRGVLGVLWSSSVFPGRAPEGHVLIRAMVGGLERPELVHEPEGTIEQVVLAELGRAMGVHATPSFRRIIRWPRAIPVPEPGHAQRMEQLRKCLARHHGLRCIGNFLGGVSVNDCIANAYRAAEETVAELTRARQLERMPPST